MADENLPSPETLRNLLEYDPETGALTWRPRPVSMFAATKNRTQEQEARRWNRQYAGTPALTSVGSVGYLKGRIWNRQFSAHRVAWAIFYGEWPADQVDHRNGVRADNRIDNLRAVSCRQNQRNKKMTSLNTSGRTGVAWRKERNRWVANIRDHTGKRVHLGYFADFTDACAARSAAEAKYGYSERHGRAADE